MNYESTDPVHNSPGARPATGASSADTQRREHMPDEPETHGSYISQCPSCRTYLPATLLTRVDDHSVCADYICGCGHAWNEGWAI